MKHDAKCLRVVWHTGHTHPLPHGALDVKLGAVQTPFGICRIADTPHGICHVSFDEDGGDQAAPAQIMRLWPRAKISLDNAHAALLAERIFQHPPSTMWASPLLMVGSAFQICVWSALMKIPAGHTMSYRDLAAAIGRPQAARAVGTAVGANHIALLIPCHRVWRADGGTGGYRWGPQRKESLLAWEQGRI